MRFLSLAILLLLTVPATAQTAGGVAQSGHFSTLGSSKHLVPTK